MRIRSITTSIALATTVTTARAQDTIAGCVQIDCPASSRDTANDNCTIADSSYPSIGWTRMPGGNQSFVDVSWTKAFNITDSSSGRVFHSSFYLGTSPDLDLTDTGACAVFFNGISETLSFKGAANDETAQGTCQDALPAACVDALVTRAREFNTDGASADVCTRLRNDLEENLDKACQQVTRGSPWANLTAVALTGDGAAQPISDQQNSTSTCWPVLPKTDSLTLVSDYAVPGSLQISEAEAVQWAITPILTLFYRTGDGSIITSKEASLTCAKVIGPAKASLDTISDGPADEPGAAVTISPRLTLCVAAGLMLWSLL